MARTTPLIPLPLLIAAIVVVVVLIVVSAYRPVRERWPRLLLEVGSLSALGLIHLLFFWRPYRTPALVPAGGGDLASFFYPIHVFAAREIQDGRFPFWNPHLYSGMPHLANFQTAVLYPLNMLAYLLARPFDYATMELLATSHYLIASIGVYLLARALGLNRPGSVLAGSIFAYSGFLVAHLGHYSMLATAAWAPFVYAAIVWTIRRHSWSAALLGTLALATCVLGGHQPMLLMVLTLAVLLTAFELWRSVNYPHPREWRGLLSDRTLRFDVLRCGFMAVVALGLTAPALGPAFELTRYTARSGLSYERATEFSVQPIALIHMIVPTVFGSNPTDYWGPFSNTEIWGYAGVLSLALAAYGVAVRWSRTRVFWLLVAVFGVLYLLGPFASLHGWAYAFLPGFDRIRGAGRAYVFVDLAIALLSGYGLQALIADRHRWTERQGQVTRWGLRGLAVALLIVAGFVIPLLASRVLSTNDPGNRPVIALDNANLLALWLLLGLGVAVAAWRSALRGGVLVVAVFAVVLLDLFHATAPFNPTTDPILAGFQHQQAVSYLQQRQREQGPFRIEVQTPLWQPDLARIAGLDDIEGLVDPLTLERYETYLNAAKADRTSEQYRALNVRYLISDTEREPPGPGFQEALRTDDGLDLWEYTDPRPRAWIESTGQRVPVESMNPGHLTLSIPQGVDGGTLIISQTDYPGWTASANGQTLPVNTHMGALQSVDLPADAATVELKFQPRYWYAWLGISGVSVVAWLVLVGYAVQARYR